MSADEPPSRAPAIAITDLEVTAGTQVLLRDAKLEVARGEFVLLLGVSGTGKSLTLALLAGLFRRHEGLRARGRVEVAGRRVSLRGSSRGTPGTGIVFQDFALFDDCDATGNVLFALDHARDRGGERPPRRRTARTLLEEFGLPPHLRPARMSGGMKQRLALARAMAYRPELLLYDEPTSGLDVAMADRVAERIREVHDRHGLTTLVVTHDLPPFAQRCDRVILLDPRTRSFREVRPEDAASEVALLEPPGWDAALHRPRLRPLRLLARPLEATGGLALAGAVSLLSLLPAWRSPRWGLRYLWRFLRLTTLGSGLFFLGLAGLIAGFIVSFFTYGLLPYRGFTEPVLSEEFLGSLGYALYRVVVPGICGLLFASRSGAALAAELGSRALSRQLDAMRTHGVAPRTYMLTGMLWACLLGMPLLVALAYALSLLAAMLVFLGTHPDHGVEAFTSRIHGLLATPEGGLLGTAYVLAKVEACAFVTAACAYFTARDVSLSGSEVADRTTRTIIRATLLVLLANLVFAFFEFRGE